MSKESSNRLVSYSADLHIHSALSPCADNGMIPDRILQTAIKRGIDIISITDHNSAFNCVSFDAAARERGVVFIPGIELQSSEEIHLLGYFPDVPAIQMFESSIVKPGLMRGMRNDPSRFGNQMKLDASGTVIGEDRNLLSMPLNLPIDELVLRIHEFEGVAVAAHIDRGFSVISQLGYLPSDLMLDAVEIWDTSHIDDIRSRYLTERKLTILSSSDTHHLGMLKESSMRFWAHRRDRRTFLDIMRGTGPGRITIRKRNRKKCRNVHDDRRETGERRDRGDWYRVYKPR